MRKLLDIYIKLYFVKICSFSEISQKKWSNDPDKKAEIYNKLKHKQNHKIKDFTIIKQPIRTVYPIRISDWSTKRILESFMTVRVECQG